MTLRVGLDVSGAADPMSGIGRYTRELSCALTELTDAPDLVGFHNSRDPTSVPDVEFTVRNPRWPDRALKTSWRVLGWPPIERFLGNVDVFHCSDWVHPPVRSAASVTTVHDLGPLIHPEWYDRSVVRVHERKNRDSAARADVIIAISAHTRSDFLDRFGVDESRVRVVPNGVSPHFRPAEPGQIESTCDRLGVRSPYFLFVGTRERRKNLLGLVQIFARLTAELPDASLVLVGARPWQEGRTVHGASAWTGRELEDSLDERGLLARVRTVGRVDNDELRALYSGAVAFLFPTLFEGFGLPVLEAMACGCPVVASDRSAVPEVVGDAAVLADPEDHEAFAAAALRVLEDSALRSGLVAAGVVRAARFTWARTARLTRDVYEDAARGRGRRDSM